jgi:hypothetical protein
LVLKVLLCGQGLGHFALVVAKLATNTVVIRIVVGLDSFWQAFSNKNFAQLKQKVE